MKLKLIKNLKSRVLLVGDVPKDISNVKIGFPFNNQLTFTYRGIIAREDGMPNGNWTFLSTLKDLTESDCEGLVDSDKRNGFYRNYNEPKHHSINLCFHFAKESFLSALEAEKFKYSDNTLIFIEQ